MKKNGQRGKRRTRAALAVRFRPASSGDVDDILALEEASFRHRGEMFNRRQVRHLVASRCAVATVALLRGRVVAWAVGLVRRGRAASRPSGRVYALAVHPQAQGGQIGRRLLACTLHALARRGAGRVFLEVRDDNSAALRLYDRAGFVHHRRLPDYYGCGVSGVRLKREPRQNKAL